MEKSDNDRTHTPSHTINGAIEEWKALQRIPTYVSRGHRIGLECDKPTIAIQDSNLEIWLSQ